MAHTTVNKSGEHFFTKLFTGNASSSHAITGVGFQPDWVWFKDLVGTNNYVMFDSVRGATKALRSSTGGVETTTDGVSSFDADGFTLGNNAMANAANSMVAWCWKAGNSAGSANTDGTINSTVTANTTAGFSIVKFTGNGTANSTVGHGLGKVPKFMIIKNLGTTDLWGTLTGSFQSAADCNIVYLNQTAAASDDTNVWGPSAAFTTSTFTVGDWSGSNSNTNNYIVYCFAEVPGFSKFGMYQGNNNSNGPFIYTGFRPSWVLLRNYEAGENWVIYDDKRIGHNPQSIGARPNINNAPSEYSTNKVVDFFSNGIKIQEVGTNVNAQQKDYLYCAFGQSIVGTNNTPANAR